MPVDRGLHDAAVGLLDEVFPDRPGAATAAYTAGGRVLTGARVRAHTGPAELCPEAGPVCDAAKLGDTITALITVTRRTRGAAPVVTTPCGVCRERLAMHVTELCEVAVTDRYAEDGYRVELYRELVAPHPVLNDMAVTHPKGIASIAEDIQRIARTRGRDLIDEGFAYVLSHALTDPDETRHHATRSAADPTPYTRWTTLASPALRRIGWGFERALHAVLNELFDRHAEEFEALGVTADDRDHLTNGAQGLEKVFANVMGFLETGEAVPFELPFAPFDARALHHGQPLHQFVARPLPPGPCEDDEALVTALADLLDRRHEHGVRAYLRQRQLFEMPIFPEGPGWCPFSHFAEAALAATGPVIRDRPWAAPVS